MHFQAVFDSDFFFPNADETLYYNVIAGVIAGAVSSAICNPTDVLKVFIKCTGFYSISCSHVTQC